MDFENVFIPSDVNGTGFWRILQPVMTGWSQGPGTRVRNSVLQKLTVDQNFYRGASMVMVQRLADENGKILINQFLKPLGHAFGFWTIYNIDDAMHYKDIPLYNRGRAAFLGDDTQERIGEMLRESDFILTTTSYIKEYYHRVYDVPLDHIIALPNLLPRWWAGSLYDKDEKARQFIESRKHKNRPRVGFVSSLSHFNLDNVHRIKDGSGGGAYKTVLPNGAEIWRNDNGEVITDTSAIERAPDDLDLIEKTIRETVDDVHWVIMGYAPPSLSDLLNAGKIEYVPSIDIINYPKRLNELCLQAVVAPLQDQEFNRCKSNIKYLECAATGIYLFASDIITYNRFLPEHQLFKTSSDLTAKIKYFAYQMSTGAYTSAIERQWRWLNSPADEGDFKLKNWWMEDNFEIWLSLFRMQHKSATVSFKMFRETYEKIAADKSHNDAAAKKGSPVDGKMLEMLKSALKKKISESASEADKSSAANETPAGEKQDAERTDKTEEAIKWVPKNAQNEEKILFENADHGVKIVM